MPLEKALYFTITIVNFYAYAANLIECAELKGDAVDTLGKGVADVDAPHRLDESAHLAKVLRNIKINLKVNLNKQQWKYDI